MKLKLLTMLFTLGLFTFGADVSAAEEKVDWSKEPAAVQEKAMEKAVAESNLIVTMICNLGGGVLGLSPDCKDFCSSVSDPTTSSWDKLSCCIGTLKTDGKIQGNLLTAIRGLNYSTCESTFGSWPLCNQKAALIANLCGALNCQAKFTSIAEVDGCLKKIGKSCAADFGKCATAK